MLLYKLRGHYQNGGDIIHISGTYLHRSGDTDQFDGKTPEKIWDTHFVHKKDFCMSSIFELKDYHVDDVRFSI